MEIFGWSKHTNTPRAGDEIHEANVSRAKGSSFRAFVYFDVFFFELLPLPLDKNSVPKCTCEKIVLLVDGCVDDERRRSKGNVFSMEIVRLSLDLSAVLRLCVSLFTFIFSHLSASSIL